MSIHQNQFTDEQYSGAQMFYCEDNSESGRMAECLRQRFVNTLQPENQRETKPTGDNLFLLKNAQCPMVMVECGFLSNADEAQKLVDKTYQKQVAFTVFMGVNDFASTQSIIQ